MWNGIDLQWFSAEDEGRTKDPSEWSLEKKRLEGDVAKSHKLTDSICLFVLSLVLILMTKRIFADCHKILIYYFTRITEFKSLKDYLIVGVTRFFLPIAIPLLVIKDIVAIIVNLFQNKGFIFTTKPLNVNFSKLVPNLKIYLNQTVFSKKGAWNFTYSFLGTIIVAVVAIVVIKHDLPKILIRLDSASVLTVCKGTMMMVSKLLIICSILFIVLSIFDFNAAKKMHIEKLKTTEWAAKQEYKEMEGDPETKSHLENEQRKLLQNNVSKAVSESDVVITNPTHFAVALKYDKTRADYPVVMAKGEDYGALKIRSFANKYNIPIVENRPVARELFSNVELGKQIPMQYISVIATIYAFIDYKIKK